MIFSQCLRRVHSRDIRADDDSSREHAFPSGRSQSTGDQSPLRKVSCASFSNSSENDVRSRARELQVLGAMLSLASHRALFGQHTRVGHKLVISNFVNSSPRCESADSHHRVLY